MRMDAGEESRRHQQRRRLVLDQVGHHLDDRLLDRRRELERRGPVDRARRIPLRGDGLLVELGDAVAPDDLLLVEREVEGERARLDGRSARREPPALRRPLDDGAFVRRIGETGSPRRRRARARRRSP
jgi:hypothetical protein